MTQMDYSKYHAYDKHLDGRLFTPEEQFNQDYANYCRWAPGPLMSREGYFAHMTKGR